MDLRPSDNLERMRSLLARMERAVDAARDTRQGVPGMHGTQGVQNMYAGMPKPATNGGASGMHGMNGPSSSEPRSPESAPAPIPFPVNAGTNASGKPKARAMTMEEFDAAFKRLASRQAS